MLPHVDRPSARYAVVLCVYVLSALSGFAQNTAPLSLEKAIAEAVERYPSVRVSQEQVAAAAAGIRLARTAYLPRLDATASQGRGKDAG